ncbi:cathelicidin antimicrobial peptide [Dasypus novemcinctus]|uniref:cathelicidin antimicrobial peptide n=1 Tax=Dasypus novemcinctus TaxID=9361 RepID=UPI00266028DF|nr:cathelicidin antimicrobial peptide [Dasypus novemcinctus]
METRRSSARLGRWSLLLLLGLGVPLAAAQTLSYEELGLRAAEFFNQRFSEANLYRLLELDLERRGDEDPRVPKPVSFTVKETVCPRFTQRPPELCDFKKDGLVKRCVGTVTLDRAAGNFDVSCDGPRRVKRLRGLIDRFREGAQKIGEKLKRFKDIVLDFIRNLSPRTEP